MVKYGYDAWGLPTRTNVALTEESVLILEVNPFLYKGYFYDDYTRLYYCNSRYYDPEIGRWINADDIGYLDLENISGLNLYCYCMNNPIMMSDPEGNLPKWAKLVIGGALVVGAIALTICTAGTTSVAIATALGLKAGTLTAAVVGGAIAGAAVGAVTGAMISAGTQIITNGFDNFSWKEVGLGALKGGIAGGIAGGLFGAIQYGLSAGKIANGVSRLNSAQTRLDNAIKPLRNVKNLAKMPFSGENIARTVGKVASNYNNAYSTYILAKGTYSIVNAGMKVIYHVAEFVTSHFIGKGLGLLF